MTNPSLFFLDGEAPGAPGLKGSRCPGCGHTVLLQVAACPKCGRRDLEVVCIGQRATLAQVIDQVPTKTVVVAAMGDMLGLLKGALVNHVVRRVKKLVPPYTLPSSVASTSSSSVGNTLKPLTRIMSFLRSTILKKPRASTTPMSPVLK